MPLKEGAAVSSLNTDEVRSTAKNIADGCTGQSDLQKCLEKGILNLVPTDGPELAEATLTELLNRKIMPPTSDYHDFVHKIGRATAKNFGVNPEAFFRCPLDFNYGCPHGYFEGALAEDPNPKHVAERICDKSAMTSMPQKAYFYCYHGVGHGVMMAKAYKLRDSLAICDSFPDIDAEKGCYQGTFMENVVGRMHSESRKENFSETDLLAPCSILGEKYEVECYINHAGYLMLRTYNSIRKAAEACLKASDNGRKSCLQSIGIMATNPGWQKVLLKEDHGSLTKNALEYCKEFPADHLQDCYSAAIDNLANNFKTDIRYALELCSLLPADSKEKCYHQMGYALRFEIPASDDGSSICAEVPGAFRDDCIRGISAVHPG